MYDFLDKIGLKSVLNFIKSKIPTKVSELENDSGFKTTDNDTLPYQYNTTANGEYRLLLSYQADDNSYREDYLRKSGKFTANPSMGTLSATTFKGDLDGDAATVNGHTVEKDVPADAVFTDTTYSLSSFGLTATAAELNYCDGVTSNIQTQLNSKAKTSDLNSYLPLSGGGMTGSIASSSSYSVIMKNADSTQYKFPITAKNSDDSPFMRVATSHTSSENGLLLQIFSPSGTMAAFNVYSGTSGKRISTDCELPKNYVTGTFTVSSSSTGNSVILGFKPSTVLVFPPGAIAAYNLNSTITSTGFTLPGLSGMGTGTWTYIAFK